jgi:hypothetical protein
MVKMSSKTMLDFDEAMDEFGEGEWIPAGIIYIT